MFKYLKTMNTNSHPTEIQSFLSPSIDESFGAVKAGSVISVVSGEVALNYVPTTPMYYAISSKRCEESVDVKCWRIFSGMVFEVDIEPGVDASEFSVGTTCDALPDETGKGVYVSCGGLPRFEIIDDSKINNGKVTVVVI